MYIRSVKRAENGIIEGYEYLSEIPSIQNLTELEFKKPVTFFIGENGSGKSTLMEAVAVNYGFNPEGGTKNFNFSTRETHSGLYDVITLVKSPFRPNDGFFLRAESFYNVATVVEEVASRGSRGYEDWGGKSLHEQSHGESFLALVQNRFKGHGLYLLDEPEAALSPSRQLSLIALIHQLVQKNSQVIIATHSPILMAYPMAEIFHFGEKGIQKVAYEETEHFNITRDFLENPKRMLDILME